MNVTMYERVMTKNYKKDHQIFGQEENAPQRKSWLRPLLGQLTNVGKRKTMLSNTLGRRNYGDCHGICNRSIVDDFWYMRATYHALEKLWQRMSAENRQSIKCLWMTAKNTRKNTNISLSKVARISCSASDALQCKAAHHTFHRRLLGITWKDKSRMKRFRSRQLG